MAKLPNNGKNSRVKGRKREGAIYLRQRKVCSNCKTIYYCDRECGIIERNNEGCCFCTECYIGQFYAGNVQLFKNIVKKWLDMHVSIGLDICATRFKKIIPKIFEDKNKEKVEFT